jgi:hypothetical protein
MKIKIKISSPSDVSNLYMQKLWEEERDFGGQIG